MTFTFYANIADNRVVDKTGALTQLGTSKSVIFKADNDNGSPTLELAYDATILHANYAYCSDNGYYYYLGEPVLSQQRIIFSASVDLLMTFKSEIDNLTCIIARQENVFNAYLKDDRMPIINKQDVNTINFPTGFSDTDSMILIVNGG